MKNEMSNPTCADCDDCVTMPGKSAGICIRTRRWVSRTDAACDYYAPYDPIIYQDKKMMKGGSTMVRFERRPANGCARCVWWLKNRKDDWGRCTMHHERTWWRHAACGDYDKDPFVEDTIRLTGKDV